MRVMNQINQIIVRKRKRKKGKERGRDKNRKKWLDSKNK